MTEEHLGTIERTLLKALSHKDRASMSELAAVLPTADKNTIEAARRYLEQRKLVEPVPGSTTGQIQLTAQGAERAIELPDEASTGSGGGESRFE
ncbi:MAG: hypothetical protein M9947_10010 [Thermomicrobiales bacterium]|nr:hypothetical protein [Thermomicrobiales bacterium]